MLFCQVEPSKLFKQEPPQKGIGILQIEVRKLKELLSQEISDVTNWCHAQPWRTAIVVAALALLLQLTVLVSVGYHQASLVTLAIASGIYAFTSLRWLTTKGEWGSIFTSALMVVSLSGLILLSYIDIEIESGFDWVPLACAIVVSQILFVVIY